MQPTKSNSGLYHRRSHYRHMLGGLLITVLAANAEVTLTFDTDTQGAIAGGSATSVLWNSYGGGCLALTVGTSWKPEGILINLNNADYTENAGPAPAALAAMRSELQQALINGGTLSYKITVETDAFAPSGPFPGWFQTIYLAKSWAGWDQSLGGSASQGQLSVGFGNPAAPLANKVEFTVSYPIEAASAVIADARAQFRADSAQREIFLGLNTEDVGGSVRYYIDDFKIAANAVVAPVVIPTVSLTPAVPGLNMIASAAGAYDRQAVRTTIGADVTWVGGTFPKTYEITVADYPKVDQYETFINLVAGSGTPNSFAQYSEPVCAGLWINSDLADGGGTAYFRYKNGLANSNGPAGREYWVQETAPSDGVGGQIASKHSTKMLGTWKITFTSDTDFTITVPDGTTATGSLNAAFAAKFGNPDPENNPTPIVVYFGNTPGGDDKVGLTAVHSHIKISGTHNTIDEDLVTNPISSDLVVAASVPAAVVQVDGTLSKSWINWSLPATDFQLEQSTDLGAGGAWSALPSTVTYATKAGRSRLLLESEVLSPTRNFFRLVKPGTVVATP